METAFDHETIVRQMGIIIGKLGREDIREQRSEKKGLRGSGRIYFRVGGLTRKEWGGVRVSVVRASLRGGCLGDDAKRERDDPSDRSVERGGWGFVVSPVSESRPGAPDEEMGHRCAGEDARTTAGGDAGATFMLSERLAKVCPDTRRDKSRSQLAISPDRSSCFPRSQKRDRGHPLFVVGGLREKQLQILLPPGRDQDDSAFTESLQSHEALTRRVILSNSSRTNDSWDSPRVKTRNM